MIVKGVEELMVCVLDCKYNVLLIDSYALKDRLADIPDHTGIVLYSI